MHDGSVQQADSWFAAWIPQIIASPDYQSGHLTIVIVWDEGSGDGNVPSTVAMIVMSPYVVPGTKSSTYFTHYSLLGAAEGRGRRAWWAARSPPTTFGPPSGSEGPPVVVARESQSQGEVLTSDA